MRPDLKANILKKIMRSLAFAGLVPFIYILLPLIPSVLTSVFPVLVILKNQFKRLIFENHKLIKIGAVFISFALVVGFILKNQIAGLYISEKKGFQEKISLLVLKQNTVDSFFNNKRRFAAIASNSVEATYKLEIILRNSNQQFSRRILGTENFKLPSYITSDFCHNTHQVILKKLGSSTAPLCEFEIKNLKSQYSVMSHFCDNYLTQKEISAVQTILSSFERECAHSNTRQAFVTLSSKVSQLVMDQKDFSVIREQFSHASSLNNVNTFKIDNIFFLRQNQGKATSEDLNTCFSNIFALLTPDFNYQNQLSSFLPWLNTNAQEFFIVSIISPSKTTDPVSNFEILSKRAKSIEVLDHDYTLASSTMCYIWKTQSGIYINDF